MSAGEVDLTRLRAAMGEANLDQSGLARELGVTPGAINQILSGKTKRSRYMPAIAARLGVSLAWLLSEADSPQEGQGARLSPDERRLLSNWRRLRDDQQQAVMQILDSMVPSGTLHSVRHTYRAKD